MNTDRNDVADTPPRETAHSCLAAGFEAAEPERIVDQTIDRFDDTLRIQEREYDLSAFERIVVVGGGKGAGRVAAGVDAVIGDRIDQGMVVTDTPIETDSIAMLSGTHPVPSAAGVDSTRTMLETLESADSDTLVIAILTGGGSALLAAPVVDVSLDSIQTVTEALLASGASIHEINAVRKHLSAIKGGGLARTASPATVVGVILSDVVGNDVSVIASGPTAPDPTNFADSIDVLDRYRIDPPPDIDTYLRGGHTRSNPETPGPDDPIFRDVTNHVLADGMTPLRAAESAARERGYTSLIVSSRVRGESRAAAQFHAAIAEEIRATNTPVEQPAVILSGGETTVEVGGAGQGGPNQEFVLAAALEFPATADLVVASVDTDGIDGPTDAAGAIADGLTVDDRDGARAALDRNDSYPYLDAREALIRTGRMGTNLNDFRVLVVETEPNE